jgi:hypothetical protein
MEFCLEEDELFEQNAPENYALIRWFFILR